MKTSIVHAIVTVLVGVAMVAALLATGVWKYADSLMSAAARPASLPHTATAGKHEGSEPVLPGKPRAVEEGGSFVYFGDLFDESHADRVLEHIQAF